MCKQCGGDRQDERGRCFYCGDGSQGETAFAYENERRYQQALQKLQPVGALYGVALGGLADYNWGR